MTRSATFALTAIGLALAAPVAVAEPVAYEFDKDHTTIVASWDHLGFSRQGIEFTDYDGNLMLDMETPENSSIEVTFNLADGGFWVGTPGVDSFENHLSSGDLLDVEAFPTATFTATSFETEDGKTGTMTGELTLKGETRPVTLDVTLNKAGEMRGTTKAGFSATGTMMRSEWGIDYAVPGVSDELQLMIETELVMVADEASE
ncbi:YceI family protein [Henriciella marina]|jgi:polyisoprenoid-binding protein YceI|uniref:YceI family protein n=1 Tax=Henriciella marina TaxID=453851 RepID=A0ABT4LR06_9PROT|nr:YceI family protein [Henriciella marina]MCZ4296773.1 YceI family protein [Henriciella marina]